MLSSNVPNVWPRRIPPFVDPTQPDIHWSYYYSGIKVSGSLWAKRYWRFDTPYAYRLGSGYKETDPTTSSLFLAALYTRPQSRTSTTTAPTAPCGRCFLTQTNREGVSCRHSRGAAGGPSGGPLLDLYSARIDIFLGRQAGFNLRDR